MKRSPLPFGPVVVEGWFEEQRICYYDDDDLNEDSKSCAIVYPGDMPLAMTVGSYDVPYASLRAITTEDLWNRREQIHKHIGLRVREVSKDDREQIEKRYELLLELAFVDGILMDRLYEARFHVKGKNRASVFISHSSKDKKFANWLCIDLANARHRPWLDEWDIKAGESIPTRIEKGISECDFVVLVLSGNAIKSHWVEREWQAKYWDEVKSNRVMVVPVLLEDCEIPPLLQPKKYADFRSGYNEGFETLLAALQGKTTKRLTVRSTRARARTARAGKRRR